MTKRKETRKKLIRIKSWKELFSRPKFKRPIDPKKTKLKEIIGDYKLEPKNPCSLSNCGTKHNYGYLITCGDDSESNIGNICGRREFPEFVIKLNVFRREKNAQRYLDNINTKRAELPAIKKKVEYLASGARQAEWCYEQMKAQDTKAFDQTTANSLREMSKRKDPYIRRQRNLAESEREIAKETGASTNFQEEQIAMIAGISAITDYKKLKNLFKKPLGENLSIFKTIDMTAADHNQLLRWHNYANNIDKNIKKAESIIEDCHRFLTRQNLSTIAKHKQFL